MRRQRSVPIHAQALNILRSYGTNAHLYLPGVGVVNGITAGNWLDSAGTTPATVDNPVGLVIDAAGAIGPELVTGQTWTTGSANTTISLGSTVVFSGAAPAATGSAVFAIQVGKTYRTTFVVSGLTAGQIGVDLGGASSYSNINSNGTFTQTTVCAGGDSIYVVSKAVGTSASVQVTSVREITGIHASQNTTASKPILRSTAGIQSWQFDGADDYLSLGSVPFQMADDHCVVAGAKTTNAGNLTIFEVGPGNGTTPRVCSLRVNNFAVNAIWSDGTVTPQVFAANAVSGVPFVVSGRKTPAGVSIRKDGIFGALNSAAMSGTTSTGAFIGNRDASTGEWMNGHIYPVIAIKGAVSDADLLTLEKFVGSLSGVTV